MVENKKLEILVIGAGPSGLAFSINLAKKWRNQLNHQYSKESTQCDTGFILDSPCCASGKSDLLYNVSGCTRCLHGHNQ